MDFSTCRVISALSHLIGSQRGFFVPGEPRTGDTRRNPRDDRKEKLRTEYLKVQFRHFLIELFRQQEDIDLVSLSFLPISQKIKLRQFETVLLRRTPTKTASRHSASPTQDCSKLGTYAKDSNKWGQTKMCTICHPVAWNTGDITNGTSRSHKQIHNDRSPAM